MKAKDYPFESVRISCTKCGRQGRYSRAAFVEMVGAETEIPKADPRRSPVAESNSVRVSFGSGADERGHRQEGLLLGAKRAYKEMWRPYLAGEAPRMIEK